MEFSIETVLKLAIGISLVTLLSFMAANMFDGGLVQFRGWLP